MITKKCKTCNKRKNIDKFYYNRLRSCYHVHCIKCTLNNEKKKLAVNPEHFQNKRLKKNFGITLETYNKMSTQQDHLCNICKKPESTVNGASNKIQKLAVDHNHITGKIRGLLCAECNLALGKFKEDISILTNAIEYLRKYNE